LHPICRAVGEAESALHALVCVPGKPLLKGLIVHVAG